MVSQYIIDIVFNTSCGVSAFRAMTRDERRSLWSSGLVRAILLVLPLADSFEFAMSLDDASLRDHKPKINNEPRKGLVRDTDAIDEKSAGELAAMRTNEHATRTQPTRNATVG